MFFLDICSFSLLLEMFNSSFSISNLNNKRRYFSFKFEFFFPRDASFTSRKIIYSQNSIVESYLTPRKRYSTRNIIIKIIKKKKLDIFTYPTIQKVLDDTISRRRELIRQPCKIWKIEDCTRPRIRI